MYDELCRQLRAMANTWGITLPREAADVIEELSRELDSMNESNIALYGALPKWIPVTERLPEDYEMVLTCDEKENIHIFCNTKKYNYPFGIRPENPRFYMPKWWMPLPEPPKEGE